MAKRYNIQNLNDLKNEQSLLKATYQIQGETIKKDVGSYIRNFSFVNLVFKKHSAGRLVRMGKPAMPEKAMTHILPLLLNKTLFRNAGWLKKLGVHAAARLIGKRI